MIFHAGKEALTITGFVFAMMVAVDYFNVLSRGRLEGLIRGGRFRQYLGSSFLGATPGCLGAFASSSLYIHGFISFGAITAAMIATSGDAAFVMLAAFPGRALLLFGILFLLGPLGGWIADRISGRLQLRTGGGCDRLEVHGGYDRALFSRRTFRDNFRRLTLQRAALILLCLAFFYILIFGAGCAGGWGWIRVTMAGVLVFLFFVVLTVPEHFLETHIWEHTVREHLPRIFLWTLGALFLIHFGEKYWALSDLVERNPAAVLLLAGLIGLIPDSGPHLVFVFLFARGAVPFSVLLTSSIVQDGHGILPILSASVKDFALIKVFNLAFGLAVGYLALLAGF